MSPGFMADATGGAPSKKPSKPHASDCVKLEGRDPVNLVNKCSYTVAVKWCSDGQYSAKCTKYENELNLQPGGSYTAFNKGGKTYWWACKGADSIRPAEGLKARCE